VIALGGAPAAFADAAVAATKTQTAATAGQDRTNRRIARFNPIHERISSIARLARRKASGKS
jgi:hypothetical protein